MNRRALIGYKFQKVTEILTKECEQCCDFIRMEWADLAENVVTSSEWNVKNVITCTSCDFVSREHVVTSSNVSRGHVVAVHVPAACRRRGSQ